MAARAAPQREIDAGDIVLYDGEQWTVLSRLEEPGLEGRGPAVTLRLERQEVKWVVPSYGAKPKRKVVPVHKSIAQGRVRLMASQASMFDEGL